MTNVIWRNCLKRWNVSLLLPNKLEEWLEGNIEYLSDDEYGLQLTEKGDYFNQVLDKIKELRRKVK